MKSSLNIKKIRTDRFSYEFNPNNEDMLHHHTELDVQYGVEVMINEENFKDGIVFLSCAINKQLDFESVPFKIDILVVGFFEVEEGVLQDFIISCVSMLMPYIRAHIATLTSIAGIPTVTLPAINVYQLIESLNEKSFKEQT